MGYESNPTREYVKLIFEKTSQDILFLTRKRAMIRLPDRHDLVMTMLDGGCRLYRLIEIDRDHRCDVSKVCI